jgi:hypothetical protein
MRISKILAKLESMEIGIHIVLQQRIQLLPHFQDTQTGEVKS